MYRFAVKESYFDDLQRCHCQCICHAGLCDKVYVLMKHWLQPMKDLEICEVNVGPVIDGG